MRDVSDCLRTAVVDDDRAEVREALPILLVAAEGYSIAGRGGVDAADGGRGEGPEGGSGRA